jgi:hypothetical protein
MNTPDIEAASALGSASSPSRRRSTDRVIGLRQVSAAMQKDEEDRAVTSQFDVVLGAI